MFLLTFLLVILLSWREPLLITTETVWFAKELELSAQREPQGKLLARFNSVATRRYTASGAFAAANPVLILILIKSELLASTWNFQVETIDFSLNYFI